MAVSPLDNSLGALCFSVNCDGNPLSENAKVVSIETTHAINRIPSAIITILDGDLASDSMPVSDAGTLKPGTEVVISAGYDLKSEVIFTGIVIKHALQITGDNYARLVIECRDKALAMTIGRKNENYVDKSDQQIISSLIAKYTGLSSDVESTDVIYKELVQYYVSDWDYLMTRAEVNGLWVMVDAGKVSVKAPVASGSPVLSLTYGFDVMEFQAEVDARWQLSKVTGNSWDLSTHKLVQETSPAVSLTGQGDLASSSLAKVLNAEAYTLQSAAILESASLKAWGKAQQLKAELSRVRGDMKFQGSSLVKPGVLLELKCVGKHFNGNVIASQVKHSLSEGNWVSEVEFGMPSYWFTEEYQTNAADAAGWNSGITGLHIGIVMKLEEDPESQYKVQVSMPLMNAKTVGVWARFASFYGSSGFGAFILPEIGDEVVLGFFNNDPSYPVILGSLYSAKHKPAYPMENANNIKALLTRSKLLMEFDDENKAITLITPNKNKIVISDKNQSILIQDETQNKVELSSSGILIKSPKDITISADGKVMISAQTNVEVKATSDVKIDALNISQTATASLVAKGSASAELSAGGQTTIKGAMVMIN
jgi:Rhs element Vgr protein